MKTRDVQRTWVLQRREADGWGRLRVRYLNSVNDAPFAAWFEPFELTGRLRWARHFLSKYGAMAYLRNKVPDAYSEQFSVVHVPLPAHSFDAESVYPFNID